MRKPIDGTPDWDSIMGKSLHQLRLETIIAVPELFDGSCVKDYGIHTVCVICDATAYEPENLKHSRENCQVEFDQIIMFSRYLIRQRAA